MNTVFTADHAGKRKTDPSRNPPADPLIVILGQTATGKTEVAIALAERIGGEIISADSMQVYRGLDIGTAKPDSAARSRVPFHLLDIVDPDVPFNASHWKAHAETAIREIKERGRRPIVCGGTGMYIKALLEGWTLAGIPADASVRARLQNEMERYGANALHSQLKLVDPTTAERLHPNDAVRISRALEVFQVTGRTIAEFQQDDRDSRNPIASVELGLTMPRTELYERVDRRVDVMLAQGLELEVRGLLAGGCSPDLPPMKSLGYREMSAYILSEQRQDKGSMTYANTVDLIKQNTRRFAKRQQTWFGADPNIRWFDVSGKSAAQIADILLSFVLPGISPDTPCADEPVTSSNTSEQQ